jgi:hypothetical protein
MSLCPFMSTIITVTPASTSSLSSGEVGATTPTVSWTESTSLFVGKDCVGGGCQLWNPSSNQCNLGYTAPPPPDFVMSAKTKAAIQAKMDAL